MSGFHLRRRNIHQLDCGTHGSRHGLFSCVCNPGKTDRHQFFDTTISTNWTYEDYHTWFDSLKVN
ncbi:hypothetical protein TVAG_181710 [Trichomonas vaginalis G3]|uniref:Uncharacterized protein n=1 Tax=Trichomonas vaginalis (strain ATCC PRA-98 / G3) TaxID=412133 RepID=A2GCN9_TRIV3|nr:hypothetical protein TVAGG3_0424460 [Trichomonas vaginalis G3]EAX85078.1 hypothetical protein TVAG_181710 [Trichomonas vaginalis G3]KAI5536297.1 hypothetical protein TVAGG3_0424460 [Trichomonas vaginalis G3]|eukprot:XP_001298008.1 hypothetical protein [Trichomonas vaginalis G3]